MSRTWHHLSNKRRRWGPCRCWLCEGRPRAERQEALSDLYLTEWEGEELEELMEREQREIELALDWDPEEDFLQGWQLMQAQEKCCDRCKWFGVGYRGCSCEGAQATVDWFRRIYGR